MSRPPDNRTPTANPGFDALHILTELGRGLASAYRPATAVEHAALALQRYLTPHRLLVILTDLDTDQLTVAYANNYANARPENPLIRRVISEGNRVLTTVSDSDFGEPLGADAPEGRPWLGIPITAAGRTIGAIALVGRTPGDFADWQADFAHAVAAQLALALENARLLELLSTGRREWEETVHAIRQAFCVVDSGGTIRRANRAFGELVRIPVPSLTDQPWIGVLPRAWADSIARVLASADGSAQAELRTGSRLFSLAAYRLRDGDETAVLVFEDQTDKRRLQQQLIQSEKMSAIGQLIAGVAHDLNNPLASVVGFADYLVEESGHTPAHMRGPLRAIRHEAERAANIVRNLLTFARKHEGQRRPQAVGPMLNGTLLLLRNQLMASKVQTELHIEDDLPNVEVDKNQIQQVFVNLINNAAQAIQSVGREGHIWVSATKWLEGVAVTVEDDGPGIPDEIVERIFEPFFTTKKEGEGTGLGLSICHGIIKEHGGRIAHAPREGGGAHFRIELPGGTGSREPAAAAIPDTGRLNILVVDDEPHILHYMVATLEAWGHQVAIAREGTGALNQIANTAFDVIICDLRMPGVGGREFYQTLLEVHPEISQRVVFATGDTVHGGALQFLESSGQPFLRKPFTLGELRSALAEAAGK